MKRLFKLLAYTVIALIFVAIISELWYNRGYFVSDLSGIYVSEKNTRDTLILRSDKTFEQTVYNKNGEKVYHVKATWRVHNGYAQVDSIFACEEISQYPVKDSTLIREELFSKSPLLPRYCYGKFSLWYTMNLDCPEQGIYYIRIDR